MSGVIDRGLPPRIIDLVHDGVPVHELKVRGDKAVWTALRLTAMSAAARGWERWEWEPLVLEPGRRLGEQARRRGTSKHRTALQLAKLLDSAWTSATAWLDQQPAALSRQQLREQGDDRAHALLSAVADPDADLSGSERPVLAHAARVLLAHNAAGRSLDRAALPRQQMLEATGLGLTALRTTLRRLDERNLLVLAEAGRRRAPGTRQGIANVYALPTLEHLAAAVYLYRETRSVVPPGHLCSAPAVDASGAPRLICSAPHHDTGQEATMVTLTLSAPDAQELAAALAMLRRETTVEVSTTSDVTLPPNVSRLQPHTGRAS